MEEELEKVVSLGEVENLVTQKYILEESKEYWQEILKKEKIEHKFKIEETTEYRNGTKYKSQLQTRYVLNLYAKNEDINLIKNIIHEYSNSDEQSTSNKEEIYEEEIYEEYEELLPRKLSKYFIAVLMIILLIFEIAFIFSTEITDRTSYIFIIILMIIEIFAIIKLLKKKKKRD